MLYAAWLALAQKYIATFKDAPETILSPNRRSVDGRSGFGREPSFCKHSFACEWERASIASDCPPSVAPFPLIPRWSPPMIPLVAPGCPVRPRRVAPRVLPLGVLALGTWRVWLLCGISSFPLFIFLFLGIMRQDRLIVLPAQYMPNDFLYLSVWFPQQAVCIGSWLVSWNTRFG